jgi:FkbM family methyltransferase
VGKLAPAFGGLAMHSRSRQVADAPDTITGSAPQWGYLASVIRTERESATGLEAVQLRLRVREGTVGVGLLDAQGAAFVDSVDGIEGDAVTAVTFFVRGMQQTGRLVIRNAGTGPATFQWLGVDSLLLKDRPDLLRECLRPHDLTTVPGWSRYYGNFAHTPAEAIRQLLFDELREPLVMPWVRDLRVTITPGEETSRALFVSGTYEPASMIAVQRLLAPGGVLFDVGANVGLYTLLGSRCVGAAGHVYSFEPSSRERTTLDANLGLNGCRNVTTSAAAVGARTGSARLRIAAGQHRGQNTLSPAFAYPGVGLEREEEVEMVSLDQFTQIPGVRQPSVIKIDAEGNDLDVLRGARSVLRDAMPVVMVEVNDTLLQASGASRADVEAFLLDVGYELFRISEDDAALVRVSSLRHEQSENFVAIPAR